MSTIFSAKKPTKGRPSVDSEAVNVRMERPYLTQLDDWRRTQPDLPTRPEAIRRLIEAGLQAGGAPEGQLLNQVPPPSPSGLASILPAIIAQYSHPNSGTEPEHVPEVVADAVADALHCLDIDVDDVDAGPGTPEHTIVSAFGGAKYVRQALEWRTATRRWKESRSKAKGEAPAPPELPG